ncbi:hypothetical protein KUCAC02_014865 [Chaenocephalus aceratus]|uniref:Uncharacterized protein n=1 Tax=Chaenocephalus aceratus TaxID=36190 RepID=A0ACB9WGN8_CHAAC|nr:hypothetical protein KUCAC02_014865 [Chaenocephalus aceratus]
MSDSDGGIEGRQRRDAEGESVTDNTGDREEEGGRNDRAQKDSETGLSGERDRIQSGEEGFVTLSSGGDDERDEEEAFEDCREFLESSHDALQMREGGDKKGWTVGKEDVVDEDEEKKKQKYVFSVIGVKHQQDVPVTR